MLLAFVSMIFAFHTMCCLPSTATHAAVFSGFLISIGLREKMTEFEFVCHVCISERREATGDMER
jgi:hypothetical protein